MQEPKGSRVGQAFAMWWLQVRSCELLGLRLLDSMEGAEDPDGDQLSHTANFPPRLEAQKSRGSVALGSYDGSFKEYQAPTSFQHLNHIRIRAETSKAMFC